MSVTVPFLHTVTWKFDRLVPVGKGCGWLSNASISAQGIRPDLTSHRRKVMPSWVSRVDSVRGMSPSATRTAHAPVHAAAAPQDCSGMRNTRPNRHAIRTRRTASP